MGFLNDQVSSQGLPDTTTVPHHPTEAEEALQDAQNSGWKCNILAAHTRDAPYREGVEQCWKADGPEKTSFQTTTFLRAWNQVFPPDSPPSPSTMLDAEKKCNEVGRDVNTVTFLKNNGGDDMED